MPGRVPRRMIGRVCKHLDAITAARLYRDANGSNEHDRLYKRHVMLSCGGTLAGSIWTLVPTQWEYFTSSHFVMASPKRLATVTIQDGFFCQLMEGAHSTNPRKCGEILDLRLIHPCAACNKGPVKNRQHDYLKLSLGDSLHAAHAHVDYERVVPELCLGDKSTGRGSDAVLDIVAVFPNAMRQYWIDVTISTPMHTVITTRRAMPPTLLDWQQTKAVKRNGIGTSRRSSCRYPS